MYILEMGEKLKNNRSWGGYFFVLQTYQRIAKINKILMKFDKNLKLPCKESQILIYCTKVSTSSGIK